MHDHVYLNLYYAVNECIYIKVWSDIGVFVMHVCEKAEEYCFIHQVYASLTIKQTAQDILSKSNLQ